MKLRVFKDGIPSVANSVTNLLSLSFSVLSCTVGWTKSVDVSVSHRFSCLKTYCPRSKLD